MRLWPRHQTQAQPGASGPGRMNEMILGTDETGEAEGAGIRAGGGPFIPLANRLVVS